MCQQGVFWCMHLCSLLSNKVLQCSYEIAEQPAMQELMLNNTSLAQKLLVGVMKHAASKQASLENA